MLPSHASCTVELLAHSPVPTISHANAVSHHFSSHFRSNNSFSTTSVAAPGSMAQHALQKLVWMLLSATESTVERWNVRPWRQQSRCSCWHTEDLGPTPLARVTRQKSGSGPTKPFTWRASRSAGRPMCIVRCLGLAW